MRRVNVVLTTLAVCLVVSVTAARLPAQGPPSAPTYTASVSSLLAAHCAACHHAGGPAPFTLTSYEDAASHAQDILRAVESERMPKWKPEPGVGGPFVRTRHLSEQEVTTIKEWVAAGAPRGEGGHAHAATGEHGTWRLGAPDVVVQLPEAFILPAGRDDTFRNFAVRVPTDVVRHIKGIEFIPDNHLVTHHANIRVDPTNGSARLDAKDPGPGYEGIAAPTAVFPDGHFLGWTPGQGATFLPDGLAWRLAAGSTLAVELHMVPTTTPQLVNFKIGLYFTDTPATRTPVMIRLGKQDLDIEAGAKVYSVHDEFTLPVDVTLLSLQPHAHYLAKEVSGSARLPDGTRIPLLLIKDWEFHIQDVYRLESPLFLPKGTVLRMDYSWDNSATNPRRPPGPPRRVRWGQYTSDEMGDLWMQLMPRDPNDFPLLAERARVKQLQEDIVGYKQLLARTPDNALLHANIAASLFEVGEPREALSHLRLHAQLDPESAVAWYNMGAALAATGAHADAERAFRRAIALDPTDVLSYNGLGGVLLDVGRDLPAALEAFQQAVRLDPSYAAGFNNIGVTLSRMGRNTEALRAHLTAIDLDAGNVSARFNAAGLLTSGFFLLEATALYKEALVLAPRDRRVATRLAWVLATTPQHTQDDIAEALRLARRVVDEHADDAEALDALAAAQAASGEFDDAVASARRALGRLDGRNEPEWVRALEARVALYRSRRAFVLSP